MNLPDLSNLSPERVGQTIKQLRAGELAFTERNILAVLVIYVLLHHWKMIDGKDEDRRWALRFATQDILAEDDDMQEWLERESFECEGWLIPAMQQEELAKGAIIGREQCRQIIRRLSDDILD